MVLAELNPCQHYETPARARASRLIAVGVAVAAALVVWLIAGPIASIDLDVRSGGAVQHVGPGAVVMAALVGGAVAWGLAALAERLTSRPRLIWTAAMVILALLSVIGPLSLGIGGATQGALIAMHQLVAGGLIAGMGPAVRKR